MVFHLTKLIRHINLLIILELILIQLIHRIRLQHQVLTKVEVIVATENAQMDGLQTLVPTIVYPDTTLNTNVRTTTGTSPSGSETPFSLAGTSFAKPMTLDENFFFQKPRIIASQINETQELSGQKSFYLNFDLRSTKENLSPVVDLDKKSVVAFTNRLNRITQASDLGVRCITR